MIKKVLARYMLGNNNKGIDVRAFENKSASGSGHERHVCGSSSQPLTRTVHSEAVATVGKDLAAGAVCDSIPMALFLADLQHEFRRDSLE